MVSPLNAELKAKHSIKNLPIRKDDEVLVIRGTNKGKEGKVVQVYRKKYAIHIDKLTRDKANGQTVFIPIDASKVVITKLKLDRARNALIARKAKTPQRQTGMGALD